MDVVPRLRRRFFNEFPLWSLKQWQLALLLTWAAWPWLVQWLLPGYDALAFVPVFIFLPLAYPVGEGFAVLLPDFEAAYSLGVSAIIFLLAYLGLVSWRQSRAT